MTSLRLSFVVTLLSFTSISAFADEATISAFRTAEANLIQWNQAYNSATSGSWDEKYADQQRRVAGTQALQALSQPQAFLGFNSAQDEQFAIEMNQKYQNSVSGSYIEQVYLQAADLSWSAYTSQISAEINSDYRGWEASVATAQTLDQKYSASTSRSRAEKAYDEARHVAWEFAEQSLRSSIAAQIDADFRTFEELGVKLDQGYARATSRSLAEKFYDNTRRAVLDAAFMHYRARVPAMTNDELFQFQREYGWKYQQATSGSVLEAYYKSVQTEAQRELEARIGHQPGS
jgi:hypothetical protein